MGPAEVAMEISKNGTGTCKSMQISTAGHFQQNLEVRVEHTQSDSSKKHFQDKEASGNIEEKLFPTGMVADLQQNIENSSSRSYIGKL